LPYVALLSTQILLIVALARGRIGAGVWGVVAAVVVGTALVVGRQLVAFADNARLLSSLDRTSLDLRRQAARTRSLLQRASDITIVSSQDGILSYVTPATSRVLGRAPEEFLGHPALEFVHPEDRPDVNRMARALVRRPNTPITTDVRVQGRDGSWRWIEVIGTNLLADPNVEGIIGNLRDVTEAREFGKRLRHEATHDPLTGLANRALLDERIRVDPAAGLMPEEPVAILAVDLDDFKTINDTRGHAVGDRLLNVVSDRLVHSVRVVDTVARVGGDEFAILLPGASRTLAAGLAARILEVFSEPLYIDGSWLAVHASIGVAVGQREDAEVLLRASDASMYEAKQQGKGRYVVAPR
jgi:diguanylate cyclase (GGDEF)-like protein/PAS domain S-box-containing protein